MKLYHQPRIIEDSSGYGEYTDSTPYAVITDTVVPVAETLIESMNDTINSTISYIDDEIGNLHLAGIILLPMIVVIGLGVVGGMAYKHGVFDKIISKCIRQRSQLNNVKEFENVQSGDPYLVHEPVRIDGPIIDLIVPPATPDEI